MEKRKQTKLASASRKAKPVMVRGEAYRPQDDRTLRNVVFHGIRTNQLTTKKGAAKLARDASPLYINRLAAGLQATFMSSPDIKIDAIDPDILEKISPLIDEYFRQVNAASEVIDEKYRQFRGDLGNPDGPVQLGGNDHRGASRKYKYGAIYVSPRGGVYEVHGAIYQKYLALGAESGFLGFPESDEQDTASGTGRFNHFEHGTIYWSLPSGAWAIYGPLRDRWWQMCAR